MSEGRKQGSASRVFIAAVKGAYLVYLADSDEIVTLVVPAIEEESVPAAAPAAERITG